MRKEKALFAGESSGHYYFRQTGFAENSLLAVLLVIDEISKRQKSISSILRKLEASFESGEINFKFKTQDEIALIISSLKEKYGSAEISTLDGLSIEYLDWRFNLRSSNTEPQLRLNIEAKDSETLEAKKKELISLITNHSCKSPIFVLTSCIVDWAIV